MKQIYFISIHVISLHNFKNPFSFLSNIFHVKAYLTFQQNITDTVLKCGVGEGWKRSVGPIM
jgi:hypothetical protein